MMNYMPYALRSTLKVVILFAVVFGLWSAVSYAQPVSSTELINNAKQYDGKTVTYEGEVIGDVMIRGEYAWLNVNDNVSAIGIWAPKNLTKDILHIGAYGEKGDWIEIKGVFNRSCTEHGGDLDIHAESIVKLKDGYSTKEPLNATKVRYAVISGLILILVLSWKAYSKRKK